MKIAQVVCTCSSRVINLVQVKCDDSKREMWVNGVCVGSKENPARLHNPQRGVSGWYDNTVAANTRGLVEWGANR